MINQGKLTSIVYLENDRATGAFTHDRLEILKLLSAQAAIAIENARLYANLAESHRTLETKVEERTAELAIAKQKAEAAAEVKSTFLANMSHELRSPLNAILGFAQLLLKSSTLVPEHQEKIQIIHRSGEHLLALINDVLDMAKIEAGCTTLNETYFNPISLLNDLKDMFDLKAQEKRLSFLVEYSHEVPQTVFGYEVCSQLKTHEHTCHI